MRESKKLRKWSNLSTPLLGFQAIVAFCRVFLRFPMPRPSLELYGNPIRGIIIGESQVSHTYITLKASLCIVECNGALVDAFERC